MKVSLRRWHDLRPNVDVGYLLYKNSGHIVIDGVLQLFLTLDMSRSQEY